MGKPEQGNSRGVYQYPDEYAVKYYRRRTRYRGNRTGAFKGRGQSDL